MKGDWNGSGGHVNFSTEKMRSDGGVDYINKAIENLRINHKEDMKLYGKYND